MSWVRVPFDDGGRARSVTPIDVDGRRLVAWRDEFGGLHLGDARCPHQWADLATEGIVLDGELVCTAHGWRFDSEGTGSKVNVQGRRDRKTGIDSPAWRPVPGGLEIDLPVSDDTASTALG